ncbi:nitroreductase family protein [Candidatus Zixiibacteriota bacterium]
MYNETIDCLLNHRSIRKYKPQPVEPDELELILTAGTRAATGVFLTS